MIETRSKHREEEKTFQQTPNKNKMEYFYEEKKKFYVFYKF